MKPHFNLLLDVHQLVSECNFLIPGAASEEDSPRLLGLGWTQQSQLEP